MMKIVVAPDSFKGSLSAVEVCEFVERGVKRVDPNIEVIKVPMADGGEGTVHSLVASTGGRIINTKVRGPLMEIVNGFYGILGDGKTAVIEMAAASGLTLISMEERNPMKTTTYGTGELIKHALNMGCRNIILGLGGSATNDGGAGMAQALGVRFINKNRNDIEVCGRRLDEIYEIDMDGFDEKIKECNITAACDVDNPLCGEKGASKVYGPQKGADEMMVEILDRNLEHYGRLLEKTLNVSIMDYPGAGAAGGMGAGVMAFLGASLKKGIDIVVEASGLENIIRDADLVITGEGSIDYQTAFGKTPYGVAKTAAKYNIPVVAIAGHIGQGAETLYEKGFTSIFSIAEGPISLEESMANCSQLLERASERIIRLCKHF